MKTLIGALALTVLLAGCSAGNVSLSIQCHEFEITDGSSIWLQGEGGHKIKILDKDNLSFGGLFAKDDTVYLIKVRHGKKIDEEKIVLVSDFMRIIQCQTMNGEYKEKNFF